MISIPEDNPDGVREGEPNYVAELARRFNYHQPPNQRVVDKHQQVREGCHYAANVVATACPEGREKALALTKLEEAMMWANAAIARNQER